MGILPLVLLAVSSAGALQLHSDQRPFAAPSLGPLTGSVVMAAGENGYFVAGYGDGARGLFLSAEGAVLDRVNVAGGIPLAAFADAGDEYMVALSSSIVRAAPTGFQTIASVQPGYSMSGNLVRLQNAVVGLTFDPYIATYAFHPLAPTLNTRIVQLAGGGISDATMVEHGGEAVVVWLDLQGNPRSSAIGEDGSFVPVSLPLPVPMTRVRLASAAASLVVVWEEEGVLSVKRLAPSPGPVIEIAGGPIRDFAVSSSGSRTTIVWTEPTVPAGPVVSLRMATFSGDSVLAGPSSIDLDSRLRALSVCARGDSSLVSWHVLNPAPGPAQFSVVTASGFSEPFVLSSVPVPQDLPSVARGPAGPVAVFRDGQTIRSSLIDPPRADVPGLPLHSATNGTVDALRLAWNGEQFLVCWQETGAAGGHVLAMWLDARGRREGEPFELGTLGSNGAGPSLLALAFDGTDLVAAWPAEQERRVTIVRIAPGSTPGTSEVLLQAQPASVALVPGPFAETLLLTTGMSGEQARVEAAILNTKGVRVPPSTLFAGQLRRVTGAAGTSNGRSYVVMWNNHDSFGSTIHLARISYEGALKSAILDTGLSARYHPPGSGEGQIVWTGRRYHLLTLVNLYFTNGLSFDDDQIDSGALPPAEQLLLPDMAGNTPVYLSGATLAGGAVVWVYPQRLSESGGAISTRLVAEFTPPETPSPRRRAVGR